MSYQHKIKRLINTKNPVNIELAVQLASGTGEMSWIKRYYIDCFDKLVPIWWSNVKDWDNAYRFSISEKIQYLQEKKQLRIFDFEKGGIPEQLFEIAAIDSVQIIQTNPENLPALFKILGEVRELRINQCNLAKLPNEIGSFQKLEKLDVSDNHLTDLPPCLKNLKNLNYINIHRNRFSTVPTIFLQMKQLQKIDLSTNDLDEETIAYFRKKLPISEIPKNADLPF